MTERNADTGRWIGRDVLHDLEHEAAALAALAEQGDAQAARELRALGRYLLTRLAQRQADDDAERAAEDASRRADAREGFEE